MYIFKILQNEMKTLKEFLNLSYILLSIEGDLVSLGDKIDDDNHLMLKFNEESFLEVSRKEEFSDDEIKILNFFIYQIKKNYLENRNSNGFDLFKGLNGIKSEIENSNKKLKEEILKILLTTIETKDIETLEHSKGVAYYAKKISEKFNFDKDVIEDIEYASYLHDIGKIVLKEQILFKPSKLREDEFELIKKHTEWGYKILSVSDLLRNIANYVLLHHEWYNGMGYPFGLKGDSIPIEAQIISISDYIETLLQGRNYVERISKKDLIKDLESLKNVKFKNDIVDKAIEVLKEEESV